MPSNIVGNFKMTRTTLLAVLVVALGGCSEQQPPSAGGKPIDFWVKSLDSPDAALRQKAARKLGNVGTLHEGALPSLIKALKDPEPLVRREAILAVAKFGPEAKQAIPALQQLQRNDEEDGQLRDFAAAALKKIGGP